MRVSVHRLIATLLLVAGLTGTAFAQGVGGTHLYFPGTGLSAPNSGVFTNLQVGPGAISMNGAIGSGSSINGISNFNGTMWANNFAGVDIGAKINSAITVLGNQGGTIMIAPGNYPFTTTIQCPINSGVDKPIIIAGAGSSSDYNFAGTVLQYTGNGDAVNQMTNKQNSRGCELRDLTLDGGGAGPNAVGFHFGGTIYSKTQDVMMRNFVTGTCIELDNEPDTAEPAVGQHWTERFDFHQTYFSLCGTEIYFHNATTSASANSFEHGKMDIHHGMFGAANGIVIDGGANLGGIEVTANGNVGPDNITSAPATGSLFKLIGDTLHGGSLLYGTIRLGPECMNANPTANPCVRFNIDATSQVVSTVLDGLPFGFVDQMPSTGAVRELADIQLNRFLGSTHASCSGNYGLSAGQTVEMFTSFGWGTYGAGLLAIGSRDPGNATTAIYNVAISSCSSNPSFTLAKQTTYASGAPFTVTETCHPTDVIGSGTAANPQYPQGSTTYSVTNNAGANVNLEYSFLNILRDASGTRIMGPLGGSQYQNCY